MSRSSKKGPYIDSRIEKKVKKARDGGETHKPIKTWIRGATITPEYVGLTFNVHNGHKFIPVFITETMVGHKLGEFAHTRTFRAHPIHKAAETVTE